MGAMLTCLATNLVCCFSSAACHCFSSSFLPKSSVATRVAYAVLFLLTSIFAWTMQTGWIDSVLAKIPSYPGFTFYDCPEKNCFSGNFAVARVLFSLTVFHLIFGLITIGVKNSKDFRAGIQNGWWGPKFLFLIGFIVAAFFIPDKFFHTYSIIAFGGAVLFIFIQLVLLIDFAANWSDSWVGKWENTESKAWLALLIGTGVAMGLGTLVAGILMYVYFGHKGCSLNIFFITFNLILAIIAFVVSVNKKVQEARPSSGILQAGVISLYATYLLVSGLSGEPNAEGGPVCNPFSQGGQEISTVMGTIFTFVAIAYSTSRAATKSKVLMGKPDAPSDPEAHHDEAKVPLMINESPAPAPSMARTAEAPEKPKAATPTPSAAATTPASEQQPASSKEPAKDGSTPASQSVGDFDPTPQPKSAATKEQELIEIGLIPEQKSRRKRLEEAVESGALPKSVLKEEEPYEFEEDNSPDSDDDLESGRKKKLSKDDEKTACTYNYSYYHLIFAVASMYVTMLINQWSTIDLETGQLESVGHDEVTVWVKVVSSWVAVLLYLWTLVAPILLPDRDWS